MSKWLNEMIGPTLALWLLAIASAVATALGEDGLHMPKRAGLVSVVAMPVVIATWVMADARKRGRKLCYDYDSFLYFAWPIIAPVYFRPEAHGRSLLYSALPAFGLWPRWRAV